MFHKKGQGVGGIVSAVVLGVVGVILLVAVLTPITKNLTNSRVDGLDNSSGLSTTVPKYLTGVNQIIGDNLVTFVLIGAMLLVVGTFLAKSYL